MCTCVHVYMCTCVHVYMCTCVHVYMCICVHVYMWTCGHVYCAHVHMCTCAHVDHLSVGVTEDKLLNVLYEKLYDNFIESVDAVDTGVSLCEGSPKYKVTSSLSYR
eukprot:GHVS01105310.1.p1 GENE.GHVS01105310.1~~GHVS01105310.1.p1  ORF type:complete len:106 (+),score=5.63 GHVS01105310.1:1-318(+)